MRSARQHFALDISLAILIAAPTVAVSETLRFRVNDDAGLPLPCRIHLRDEAGKPYQAGDLPFWKDHFVCSGDVSLDLEAGIYSYTIQRGTEYDRVEGQVSLESRPQTVTVTLARISNLRSQGWYSADLHIHRPLEQIEQLMKAEDLDFAPVITWWNQRNLWKDIEIGEVERHFDGHRIYHVMAGEDERAGGALMFFGLHSPLDISKAGREFPSPLHFVEQAKARDSNVAIDIEKPFWWDVPVWLASGYAHSIGIANNHIWRDGMYFDEAWGKPRDTERLPDPLGNARWTQEIYYHILNSGIRIAPSAGSASGVMASPIGYNRVYVHLDGPLKRDAWWDGLKRGNCFVTNGPLLLCTANGKLPGAVFKADAGEQLRFHLQLELTSLDRIKHVEVISNGLVLETLPCGRRTRQQLETSFTLNHSGWFLIRAVADVENTYRFASTAPFYVEVGDQQHHVSRDSVEFFQRWVEERIHRLRKELTDPEQLAEVLKNHVRAQKFWQQRMALAND